MQLPRALTHYRVPLLLNFIVRLPTHVSRRIGSNQSQVKGQVCGWWAIGVDREVWAGGAWRKGRVSTAHRPSCTVGQRADVATPQ
jgi:hypothetical protein